MRHLWFACWIIERAEECVWWSYPCCAGTSRAEEEEEVCSAVKPVIQVILGRLLVESWWWGSSVLGKGHRSTLLFWQYNFLWCACYSLWCSQKLTVYPKVVRIYTVHRVGQKNYTFWCTISTLQLFKIKWNEMFWEFKGINIRLVFLV